MCSNTALLSNVTFFVVLIITDKSEVFCTFPCLAFINGLVSANAIGNWKRTKCASDFHGFEHTQITTVESGLRGLKMCNIGEDFPDRAIWYTCPEILTFEEIGFPGVVPVSGNVAEYR